MHVIIGAQHLAHHKKMPSNFKDLKALTRKVLGLQTLAEAKQKSCIELGAPSTSNPRFSRKDGPFGARNMFERTTRSMATIATLLMDTIRIASRET